ncbi:hypothetical protein K2173_021777 [Erythroxylum novogranatense]|uniref:Bromo domain-containing protein n=1 Tax=Erythroxylum novogranatense TaxID=1862640 RepID=A0AAV8TV61_9ROSI|nr:hypothetical protein K2173_021777 [Erythroxylum novogranatense]
MIDAFGDELDDRSFNESNSTSQQQKPEATRPKEENDTATLEAVTKPEPEPDSVSPRSDPYWSHRDDDNDENEEMTMRPGQAGGVGDSNELGESVGESKREEKDKNSDVQSSASLTLKKKKRGRRTKSGGGVAVGSSSEEEPEVSPSTKRASAIKCEPLIKIIEIIRSHRLGSAFERRLRSQESERYKNLVRQHIDLQTVQHRLDKGVYSNAIHTFFRDLLLLFNNSIFFFRKNSPEHLAAVELRSLVLKQKAEKFPNLKPHKAVVRVETEPRTTQFAKPALVPCATRNNIRSQPESAVKKKEKKEKVVEETLKPKEKKIEAALVKVEENGSIKKKRTKERSRSGSSSGCRNLRASNKGNGEEMQHRYGGNELSSHDNFDMKVDKKSGYRRKRQGAASFLKRMKQNSSELTEKESDSSSSSSPSSEEEEERKDEGKGKEDKKKKRKKETDLVRKAVTRSSRGRGTREVGKSKRIGRPPKRQAQESGKRGRDVVDSEVGGGGRGSGRGRKKPRR